MSSEDWPWSEKEKRDFVWQNLVEAAQRLDLNVGIYQAVTVQDEGEYSPIFLSKSEQITILQDFAVEGKIKLFEHKEGDGRYEYHFEILEPKRQRKSVYSSSVTTVADLIKNIELRNRIMCIITNAFSVYDAREITAKRAVRTDVLEKDDELLLLTDELGLTKTDWESLQRQTHRVIGNRYVSVMFFGEKIKPFADAISGRSSIIRIKAIEQASLLIKDLMSAEKLNDFFIHWGVPTSLLLSNQQSKRDLVYNVLLALSSTSDAEDKALLFRILEEMAHPLSFGGDTNRAKDFEIRITKLFRYDGLSLIGGKIHSFDKDDEDALCISENKENTAYSDFAQNFGDIFGGGFFANPNRVKEAPKESVAPATQQPPTQKQESQKIEINIHTNNSNIQNAVPPITSVADNEKTLPKFPYKLPAGTEWTSFTMKFLENDKILIRVNKFEHTTDYREMGFVGKGTNPNPSEAWAFLKVLASLNGELTIKDASSKDKYKKQKELLAKSLKNYFSLDYDPFYPYHSSPEKEGNSYKIKITLIPAPTDEQENDAKEYSDDLGIEEGYNEQTPQVYDE